MAHFQVCLLFLLTCQCGQPVRVAVQDASSETSLDSIRHEEVNTEDVQTQNPAWTLSYEGVPCLLTRTDESAHQSALKELGHFASHIYKWGDVLGEIHDKAHKEAIENNCRVCDIEIEGSYLPINVGKHKPWIKETVSCATGKRKLIDLEDPEKSACFGAFEEHGALNRNSEFAANHPRGLCMPCPRECDAGCEMPGTMDIGYSTHNWFKCKTYNPQDFYKTVKDEDYSREEIQTKWIGSAPKPLFKTKTKYFCEQALFKELETETSSLLHKSGETAADVSEGETAAEEMDPEEPVPNFQKRSTFENQKEWKLWCKYKDDYTADVEEPVPTVGYISDGRWSFDQGVVDCRNTVQTPVLGDRVEELLPFMSVQAASGLESLATMKNCRLCDTSFGGYTKALFDVEEMKKAAANVDVVTEVAAVSMKDLWIKPVCAVEKIGLVACDHTRGAVGWESPTSCLPCPAECAYCKKLTGKDTNSFKCYLMPKISLESPTLQAMTSSDQVTVPQLDTPSEQGYSCQPAEFRACGDKNAPWCDVGHMKVECSFPATFE